MPSIAGDHPRQAFGGVVADGLVAWVETDSTQIGVPTCRIFAAGGDSGSRLVARSEEPHDGTEVLVGSPVISGGRVFWATGAADRGSLVPAAGTTAGTVVARWTH